MENIKPHENFGHIIQVLSQLSLKEIDLAMQKLIELRKQKLPSVLSIEETEILKNINRGVPDEINSRYNALKEKRNQESLTEEEHKELIELTGYMEQHDVERLQSLMELAKIRNISLEELIKNLELKPMLDAS
jgi:hypothetical protein